MDEPESRKLGVEALRALAHPLRVQLYGALSAYGPATASALAERFGESSGSTSYHLRQLERHGFVREDETRGNGRDRWWERVPGSIDFGPGSSDEEPGVRDAAHIVGNEFDRVQDALYADFRRRRDALPLEWQRAQDSSSATLQLSAAETVALSEEFHALLGRYRGRPEAPGRRRISVQFRSFPIVDTGSTTDPTTDSTTDDSPEGAPR